MMMSSRARKRRRRKIKGKRAKVMHYKVFPLVLSCKIIFLRR
jgi:hypothetical protein